MRTILFRTLRRIFGFCGPLPEHPFVCRHCPRPLRSSNHPTGGFIDPYGYVHCPDSCLYHEPMPSIR